MARLSSHPDFARWCEDLPGPLAVALTRVRFAQEQPDAEQACFAAGLDAFLMALRWASLVGIADIVRKLEERHPSASGDAFRATFPHIHRVLEPKQAHGHWVACLRSVVAAYERDPAAFFVPEFIEGQQPTETDPHALEEKLGELTHTRNRYAHGACAQLGAREAADYWERIDAWLGPLYEQLAPFARYHLVVFHQIAEHEGRGWYRYRRHLRLHGASAMDFGRIVRPDALRFHTDDGLPEIDQLYLLDPERRRRLPLHPFLLFDSRGLFGPRYDTFLFNELTSEALVYHAVSGRGRDPLRLPPADRSNAYVDARFGTPVQRRFEALKYVTGKTGLERLAALPGFPRQSNVLDFGRLIDFHTESFTGRLEYFQRVEAAVQSPPGAFRSVWVRGLAGYGKTAFLARLVQRFSDAIPYFITPEENAADATTFLLHVCQSIIDRFHLADEELTEDDAGDREALKARFDELLQRANDELERRGRGKLVLVIDGLDESARYASRPDEEIGDVLPRSVEEIPPRVFFVFSSRPDVELGDVADVTLDLTPFSQAEVTAILRQYGWDAATCAVAYERSGGQPLYFRFLLDGIKRGEITTTDAGALPEGIEGFYARTWRTFERDRMATRKAPVKAATAAISMQVLGLLGAAQEPLTLEDIRQLLAEDLPAGLPRVADEDPRQTVLRLVIRKEHLGRFLIGTDRFSLFHDTLRRFVLRQTAPAGDERPYAEGVDYHRRLADWCRQRAHPEYAARHLTYHLLHAREHEELLALFRDPRDEGRFRRGLRHTDGTVLLRRELGHAMLAARELDRLDELFRLSLLRLAVDELRRAAVLPGAADLLLKLGDHRAVLAMFESARDEDLRWRIACAGYAASLDRDDRDLRAAWTEALRSAWSAFVFRHDESVAILVERVADVDVSAIPTALALLPGLDDDDRTGGLAAAASRAAPAHLESLGKLVLETPLTESAWFFGRARETVRVGSLLLARDADSEIAWQLLDRGGRVGAVPAHVLAPFLAADPARTLRTVSLEQLDLTGWGGVGQLLAFLRLARRHAPPALLASWLAEQPPDIEGLGRALLQPEDGDDAGLAPRMALHPYLASLVLRSLATGGGSTDEPACCRSALLALVDEICEAQGTAEIEDDAELEAEFARLLPTAVALTRDVEPLFGDRKAAFWFALAASSPALERMLAPEVQAWVGEQIAARRARELGPRIETLVRPVRKKLADHLGTSSDRDDLQRLALPILFALSEGEDARGRLEALCPIERWVLLEDEALILNPRLDVDALFALQPRLVDEEGAPLRLRGALAGLLAQLACADPDAAFARWAGLVLPDADAVRAERARHEGATAAEGTPEEPPEDEPPRGDSGETLADDEDDEAEGSLPEGRRPDAVPLACLLQLAGRTSDALRVCPADDEELLRLLARGDESALLDFVTAVDADRERLLSNLRFESRDTVLPLLSRAVALLPAPERERWLSDAIAADGATPDESLLQVAVRVGHPDVALAHLSRRTDASSDELGSVILPWIEQRLDDGDAAAAGEMWRELVGFLQRKGLAFIADCEETFDQRIATRVERGGVGRDRLGAILCALPEDFRRGRQEITLALLRAGTPPEGMTASLRFADLPGVVRFATGLRDTPLPPAASAAIVAEIERLLDRGEPDREARRRLTALALTFTPALEAAGGALRRRLLGELAADLEGGRVADDERERLRNALAIVDRLASDDLPSGEPDLDAPTGFLGALSQLTPRRLWDRVGAAARGDARQRVADLVVEEAASQAPLWTLANVIPEVGGQSLFDGLLSVTQAAGAARWPQVSDAFHAALGRLPEDFQVFDWGDASETLTQLLERDPALVADLLERSSDREDWIEFFRGDHRDARVRGFLRLADRAAGWLDRLLDGIAEGTRRATLGALHVEYFAGYLVETVAPLDRSAAMGLLDRVLRRSESLSGEKRGEILAKVLPALARLDPSEAWRRTERAGYAGMYLDDIALAILDARPALADDVLRHLEGLERDSAVERATLVALTTLPLERARAEARRAGIDEDDLARRYAERGPVEPGDVERLLGMAGTDGAARLATLAAGAGNVRGSDAVRATFRDKAFALADGMGVDVDDGDVRCHFTGRGRRFGLPARVSTDTLALLYGVDPRRTEQLLRDRARDHDPATRVVFEGFTGDIRANALPTLVRHNPAWLLANVSDWCEQPWWPRYLADDVREAVRGLDPERALSLLAAFPRVDRDLVGEVLDAAADRDTLRECLEVLLAELLVRHPSELGAVVDVCLERAEAAGLDPVDLLVRWAEGFALTRRMAGLRALDVPSLIDALRGIAGEGADDDDSEARGDDRGAGRAHDPLHGLALTDEQRAEIARRRGAIAQVREHPGMEQALRILEGDLESYVNSLRP